MKATSASVEQRVVLRSVAWETYVALASDAHATGGRLTYDRGDLEIMSPGMPHELTKRLLGRMVEMFTLVRNIEIRSSASTNFKQRDLDRGFEADESYYIEHAPQLRGVQEIDLSIHPPPDLVIEIDISHSSLPKEDLFAAMRVPEVWRCDGEKLCLLGLQADCYCRLESSLVLPGFPVAKAQELLRQCDVGNETQLIRDFVDGLSQ